VNGELNPAPRPYRADDRTRLYRFLGECSAADDLAVTMHAGDFGHALTNTMRGADPSLYFHVLDGPDGDPLALIQLFKGGMFDTIVHPAHRGGDLERGLIEWSARAEQTLMAQLDIKIERVVIDGLTGEPVRTTLLRELGYKAAETPYMAITVRDLVDTPIPAPSLPDGFTIRPAAGSHEADAIGALHASAFKKANWTPGLYRKVMETPGFDAEREMLVVAPDGELAAFLVYWLDPVSRCGLFEPVGCAEHYQRRGLVKALMHHTLGLMRDAGMTRAMVKHELDNPASTAAYAAVGFVRKHEYVEYARPAAGG
jgi:GNAT superfamily N-acetyltransferase